MALTRPKAHQINFDVTNITDPLVRLNSGESGTPDKDVGIVIERGSSTNAAIIYDESADEFAIINTTVINKAKFCVGFIKLQTNKLNKIAICIKTIHPLLWPSFFVKKGI